MDRNVLRYIVVDDLFTRYTIIVSMNTNRTSVWCDACDVWVAEWEGEQLSQHKPTELLEAIIEEHEHDFPDKIEFGTERFI